MSSLPISTVNLIDERSKNFYNVCKVIENSQKTIQVADLIAKITSVMTFIPLLVTSFVAVPLFCYVSPVAALALTVGTVALFVIGHLGAEEIMDFIRMERALLRTIEVNLTPYESKAALFAMEQLGKLDPENTICEDLFYHIGKQLDKNYDYEYALLFEATKYCPNPSMTRDFFLKSGINKIPLSISKFVDHYFSTGTDAQKEGEREVLMNLLKTNRLQTENEERRRQYQELMRHESTLENYEDVEAIRWSYI